MSRESETPDNDFECFTAPAVSHTQAGCVTHSALRLSSDCGSSSSRLASNYDSLNDDDAIASSDDRRTPLLLCCQQEMILLMTAASVCFTKSPPKFEVFSLCP